MIDDAEPIEVFFGLRRDIAALSLAQYFCELAYLMVPEVRIPRNTCGSS